jgi:hypothetical protein
LPDRSPTRRLVDDMERVVIRLRAVKDVCERRPRVPGYQQ